MDPAWPSSGSVLTTRAEDNAQTHRAHSLTLGDTRVFGTNTVNAFRVAWNRSRAHYHLEPFFGAETLGITDFYNYVPGIIGLEISGGFTTASGGSVLFQGDTDAYQISDDITLVRGSHQFALGGQVAHWTTTRSTASAASVSGPSTERSRGPAWRTSSRADWRVSSTRGRACST